MYKRIKPDIFWKYALHKQMPFQRSDVQSILQAKAKMITDDIVLGPEKMQQPRMVIRIWVGPNPKLYHHQFWQSRVDHVDGKREKREYITLELEQLKI